jgi:hypothetical protein
MKSISKTTKALLGGLVLFVIFTSIPQAAAQETCVQPPPDMTGWWPGDGNTNDIVGGRNAVLRDNATFGPGLVDQAFILDGDGDFADVPHDPALNVGTGDFTVDLWVFFNDTAGEQVLVEKYVEQFGPTSTGWTFSKLDDNHLTFNSVDSAPLSLPTKTWIHFAARRSGDVATIFMKGTLVATGPVGRDNSDSTSSLKFGHRGSPSDTPGSEDERGFFLNGRIDELELFVGRALSDAEIQAIFDAGSAGKCKGPVVCVQPPSGLISWWPGDGNANDTKDGNNGTLQNGATFAAGMVGQAFSLDGIDDSVNVGNAPTLHVSAGNFTVDAWVKFDVEGVFPDIDDMSIADKMDGDNQNGWRLIRQRDNGHFWFCLGGGTINGCDFNEDRTGTNATTVRSTTVALKNVWYHVVGVLSSDQIAIYVNGIREGEKARPLFTDTHAADLLIGANITQGAHVDGLAVCRT